MNKMPETNEKHGAVKGGGEGLGERLRGILAAGGGKMLHSLSGFPVTQAVIRLAAVTAAVMIPEPFEDVLLLEKLLVFLFFGGVGSFLTEALFLSGNMPRRLAAVGAGNVRGGVPADAGDDLCDGEAADAGNGLCGGATVDAGGGLRGEAPADAGSGRDTLTCGSEDICWRSDFPEKISRSGFLCTPQDGRPAGCLML